MQYRYRRKYGGSIQNGVYMTYCYVEGVKYCSITNVGNKPTIGEYGKNIETNIFNFNENIYDKKITVEVSEKNTRRAEI